MEKLENKSIFKWLFIILILAFISPSVAYMLKGRKIQNLCSNFTFFYAQSTDINVKKIVGCLLFFGIFIGISILYYLILKHHKKIFKNRKEMSIFIVIVAVLFFVMLPVTSTDVFYYIGTGWSEAHYGVNPYYTSVDDLMNSLRGRSTK